MPLGLLAVLTGAVLVYARSISVFGAVVIIAYYPATAPVSTTCSCSPVSLSQRRPPRAADRHAGHLPGPANSGLRAGCSPGLTVPTAEGGLSVSELTAQAAGSFTLGPVSLDIPTDRVLVVLGPSGAGKTILLETIAGLRPQQAGHISLAGTDITTLPPERRRSIGLVFQDAALFPHLRRRQRPVRPARQQDGGPRRHQRPAARLGIEHLADRSPRSLSGGERQRVALARALAIQPRLLLLDEPLSALDQPTREDMRALLQHLLTQLEIPAAHVTHDRDEAPSIADDLALIVTGQLRQTGPAASVAAEPAEALDVARLLGWSELGHGTADGVTARIGKPAGDIAGGLSGPVHVFYRPEDVQLSQTTAETSAGASLTAHVERIVRTRPLARITLGCDPPVAALMLHRDIERLQLTAGNPVQVSLPPGSLRIFQTRTGP